MGGCEIDLRHASIDGEAVIDIFALWGGVELRVPPDWTVVSRVTPILGGVDDILSGSRRDYFVGAQLRFNDEDLKHILPFAPGP